jgi:hypothetical protein
MPKKKKRKRSLDEGADKGEMDFQRFLQCITQGNIDTLKKIGAKEVLDYTMESVSLGQTPREPLTPSRLYLAHIPCHIFFKIDAVSTDFGMCLVWFLEEIGFEPEEIQQAFVWFFGAEPGSHSDPATIMLQRAMQEMCNAVFAVRSWSVPFPAAQLQS